MSQITLDNAVKIANGALAVGRYDVAIGDVRKHHIRLSLV
ncbi:hypothetical protein J2848_007102 [Azospirillum lipoferum]|nr:hypothetical protein [Azospirillum lipoferum]